MPAGLARMGAVQALNSDVRPREYLTEKEIERLQETARKRSRYGHRDATMILIAYRHGLRASELCSLRWDQIELNSGRLHVRRAKGGIDNVHPLSDREIRALRQLRRENTESPYVFITERGGPATTAMPSAWLSRNVLQPWDGGCLRLSMYLATVVCPTSMPSLSSSPWMRGAPHSGLAMLIWRIGRRISVGVLGRPPRGRDFQRQ